MVSYHVGITDKGIVTLSIIEGEDVKLCPLNPSEAHDVAANLLNAAAMANAHLVSTGQSGPALIVPRS